MEDFCKERLTSCKEWHDKTDKKLESIDEKLTILKEDALQRLSIVENQIKIQWWALGIIVVSIILAYVKPLF